MQLHRPGRLAPLAAGVALACCGLVSAARADYTGQMSVEEKRFYDYGPGGSNGTSKNGTVLDSTNPIDLMNKIRRATAMDDATSPGDAVDAALREMMEVQVPASSGPSAPLVKAP
ncbi:MAG: hypothetical protein RLZZ124_598 [Cyanobacteriota bacterium]|jgi:hypothetical protein